MFERYLSGCSLGKIVDESYKKGIPFYVRAMVVL